MTDSERPEVWKPVPPPFSKYEASTGGRIRAVRTGRVLSSRAGRNGYLLIGLYPDDGGPQKTVLLHSMILATFAGPRPDGMECRHYDDNPLNNRWEPGDETESAAAGGNLFYGTKAENVEDGYRNGRPRATPRPQRHCVRCGDPFTGNGKRCHDCVVAIGAEAAAAAGPRVHRRRHRQRPGLPICGRGDGPRDPLRRIRPAETFLVTQGDGYGPWFFLPNP